MWEQQNGEDSNAFAKRTACLLTALHDGNASINPDTSVVGALLKFPVADGYAYYRVVKDRPLMLEHIPFGDGYAIPAAHLKGLTVADVVKQLSASKFWKKHMDENDRFYDNLKVGQIVHYHNGFKQYVRCRAIETDGTKKLLATALVGNWSDYDLPGRYSDGTECIPTWAKWVKEGHIFDPNVSCIYEGNPSGPDPATMPELSLEVPPMTQEQKYYREAYTALKKIGELYEGQGPNPVEALREIYRVSKMAVMSYDNE
jgi:hypothetical protein